MPSFAFLARYEWWRLATEPPDDTESAPVQPWTVEELGPIPVGTIDPRDRSNKR